jgi:hypothetical protein
MEWTTLRSTNLKEVGFDIQSNQLEIVFADGGRYRYSGVPESIYRGLVSASSAGRYFHQKIRDVYPATRL